MQIITEQQIFGLQISPEECVNWAREGFCMKPKAVVPPKISIHQPNDVFYNTMPCLMPSIGRMAVKVISRPPQSIPALMSKIMLIDANNGETLAVMDGNWITAMRTGAVAALAARTFAADFKQASFGFVGLGAMSRSTLQCLLAIHDNPCDIWLLRYKDQAERLVEEFSFSGARFHIVDNRLDLVGNTNVLFSCVTVMREQFLPPEAYSPGYLCIPVHSRGFQDCDIVFDRVFGDDAGHMRDWKNFSRFKEFAEFSDVLLGKVEGRRSAAERILSYNYGLALHDLWFASKIYDVLYKERG